jgi:hypothetical protein
MDDIDLPNLVSLGEEIEALRTLFYWDDHLSKGEHSDETKTRVGDLISELAYACRSFESFEVGDFIDKYAEKPPAVQSEFEMLLEAFWTAIEDKRALFLGKKERQWFEAEEPLGPEVMSAFPKAASDILAASKCLAFNLPTASVFHQMRAMESALAAIAVKLGIEKLEIEWAKLLSAIDGKIAKDDPLRKKWSALRQDLWHVKEATRNEVAHPRDEGYTRSQAEECFGAVAAFMKRMAVFLAERP